MTETMFTPLFDRDLICQSGPSSFGCGMPGRFGMGMYSNPYMNTSFLGGVTMAPALTSDVYGSVQRAKFKNWQNMKTVGLGILTAGATLFAGSKFSKLFKAIGRKLHI